MAHFAQGNLHELVKKAQLEGQGPKAEAYRQRLEDPSFARTEYVSAKRPLSITTERIKEASQEILDISQMYHVRVFKKRVLSTGGISGTFGFFGWTQGSKSATFGDPIGF